MRDREGREREGVGGWVPNGVFGMGWVRVEAAGGAAAGGPGSKKSQLTEGSTAPGVLLSYSPGKATTCCERQDEVTVSEQGAGSGVSVLLEEVQSKSAQCASIQNLGGGLKSMEKSLKELEALAKTLRRHKVIALPTLLWGTESNGAPDS